MIPSFIDKSNIPHRSGVYIFKDNRQSVIYVGKAIDLYHRVASYFGNHSGDVKLTNLVSNISSVETIIVEYELEALILEANLIKKYLPPFNVSLKDDKDYLYIGITKEDFPKVITLRKQDLKRVKKFFGPFPSARTVRDTLKLLRRVFPWCANPPGLRNRYSRPCFYYHIGLCPGVCAGLITKQDYQKTIRRFAFFLEGKKEELVEELFREMAEAAKEEKFEEASKVKKMLDGINYLLQPNRAQIYLENPNFLQEENKQALVKLQKDLNLEKLPERIEAYDISNIQGKDAVGSMVVLTNGEIDKSQYRKFRIRVAGRPNDVGMHKEMIRRRLNHPEWPMPDLILVDGGRGQARAVKLQITNYKLNNLPLAGQIPVLGLAKRMEWLYPPEGEVIKLSKRSLALKLLQKIRDEAHRFAVTFHRKLHQKSVILGL
ncbi:GIY-YIG nuclease family protein [Candidatus Daviesbacteria bacterium]|nr:GIY-YIG nuclease family protein [Candidatus Daviesbacteria bacterium]